MYPSLGKGEPLCLGRSGTRYSEKGIRPSDKGYTVLGLGYPSLEKGGRRTDDGYRASGQGDPRPSKKGYPAIG